MSLKNQILTITAIGILLVAFTYWFSGYVSSNTLVQEIQEQRLKSDATIWSLALQNYQQQMTANMKGLTRARKVIKALKSGDKKMLATEAMPTFQRMNAGGFVDEMTISNLQGRLLMSSDDNTSSYTNSLIEQAIATKTVTQGLVKTASGKPSLSIAFPLYSRGKPVGAASYYLYLNNILEKMPIPEKTDVLFAEELKKIMKENVDGIILDLR